MFGNQHSRVARMSSCSAQAKSLSRLPCLSLSRRNGSMAHERTRRKLRKLNKTKASKLTYISSASNLTYNQATNSKRLASHFSPLFSEAPNIGCNRKLVKLPTLGATPSHDRSRLSARPLGHFGAAMMNTTTVRLIPSEESPQPHRSKRNLPTYRVVVRRALAATASSPTGPSTAAPGASVSPYNHR